MSSVVVHRVQGPEAWRFVQAAIRLEHRHHAPPRGWKWGFVATKRGRIVGVAVVGRAVARGWKTPTLELTRSCTWSRHRFGAASALLQAAAQSAVEVGLPIVTYTLSCEDGVSLEEAGWCRDGKPRPPRRWSTPSRPRAPRPDEVHGKQRWRPRA